MSPNRKLRIQYADAAVGLGIAQDRPRAGGPWPQPLVRTVSLERLSASFHSGIDKKEQVEAVVLESDGRFSVIKVAK